MSSKKWLLLVLMLLLPATAHAQVSSSDRVWVIGDSNGWLLMDDLRPLFRDRGIWFDGNPVGGTTVFWWTMRRNRRHIAYAKSHHPTVFVVILGTNEAHFPKHVIQNMVGPVFTLTKLLEGYKVIWIGPPSFRSRRLQNGAWWFRYLVALAGQDLRDPRSLPMTMWSDGIHPSFRSQAEWARWIVDELVPSGP